jgi:hypothetical protein
VLSPRTSTQSELILARASLFLLGCIVLVPLVKNQLAKTGYAIDAQETRELAAEATYSPALTPMPRELRRPAREDTPTTDHAKLHDKASRPFIPVDPRGGEAEDTLDPRFEPSWVSRRTLR